MPQVSIDERAKNFALSHLSNCSKRLTLPNPRGEPSYEAIIRKLQIPGARVWCRSPLEPSWNRTSAVVYLPPQDDAAQWAYPGGESRVLSDWVATIAKALVSIRQSAKGGILVLNDSHEDIRLLSQAVREIDPSIPLLLPEGQRLGAQRQRVIWLATGAAWTGLDISDPSVNPEDDYLLTDLVIPRLPFGQNRTSIHQARLEYNFAAESVEARVKLLQGMGRLIRREGLRHRRIFLLDGRIFVAKYGKSFSLLLKGYTVETHTESHTV